MEPKILVESKGKPVRDVDLLVLFPNTTSNGKALMVQVVDIVNKASLLQFRASTSAVERHTEQKTFTKQTRD